MSQLKPCSWLVILLVDSSGCVPLTSCNHFLASILIPRQKFVSPNQALDLIKSSLLAQFKSKTFLRGPLPKMTHAMKNKVKDVCPDPSIRPHASIVSFEVSATLVNSLPHVSSDAHCVRKILIQRISIWKGYSFSRDLPSLDASWLYEPSHTVASN